MSDNQILALQVLADTATPQTDSILLTSAENETSCSGGLNSVKGKWILI